MPKTERANVIYLRLRKNQDEQLRALAYETRSTATDLAREAVDLLLQQKTQIRVNELEGIIAQELKHYLKQFMEEINSISAGISSLRAMAARGNRLSGASYFFLKDCDKVRMDKAISQSKQLSAGRRKLEDVEVLGVAVAQPAQVG